MNGILHTCSHPEGSKIIFSEEIIFRNICLYIQFLFNLIKPRKTFFLAVDGVAPRAKMTQQRARRFQSALEGRIAKENLKDNSPETYSFDPCVISPGTEFMERLHRHLVTFVEKHVNHDADWQCIDVILSGHDCPGEGEHKIREYMAYRHSLPDYRPNERHCIYGMDADLIFLGLTTHEINICILRENVVKAQNCSADNKPFCITYLSVLREYIDLEFTELKKTLPFPYDLERLIDDWVFMAFLLGNDFIPHIPNLHIHAESLLTVWDTYQVVLPKLDGYLVELGYLNLPRFHKYLEELSQFERDWFEEREAAFRWMRGKQGARMANELEKLGLSSEDNEMPSHKPPSSTGKRFPEMNKSSLLDRKDDFGQLTDLIDLFVPQSGCQYDNVMLDEAAELMEEGVVVSLRTHDDKVKQLCNKSDLSNRISHNNAYNTMDDNHDHEDNIDDETEEEVEDENVTYVESDTDLDEDLLVYKMHRRDYYSSKLGIQLDEMSGDLGENSTLMSLIQDYIRMLQWILNYYFLNVADWDFFYAYHYAPFVHDLILYTKKFENCQNFNGIKLSWTNFQTNSQPVLPFVQQLMILPSDSAYIVPAPYWELMTSPSSPLAEFFPKEFETDINGKIASWEAVVLIPFLDQQLLINAMKDGDTKLTEQEKQRNQHKSHLFYRACPIGRVKSPVELINHDFYRKSVNCGESELSQFYASITRSVVDDFPSLSRLPFTHKIQRIPVYVFERPSKLDSMALTMKPHPEFSKYDSLGQLAESILGRPIRVRWPFCATVMPVRLMSTGEIWELVDFNVEPIIKPSSDLPSESLRYRPLLSSEDNNHELDWINSQLSGLKRHFEKRRAILFDDKSDNDNDELDVHANLIPSSVLVFSRPLDGWSVVPVKANDSNSFTLIPNFVRSRAQNGDDLELSNAAFASSFIQSENVTDLSGKRDKKRKTLIEKPSLSIEPAYGLSDGLNLDLLGVLLPGIPPPPSIGCVEVDWGYNKTISLHTIFHPGKIVFSLAKESYGSVGEVIAVDQKKGKVMVRFYPDVSSSTDLMEFCSQVEEWEHDNFYTNIMVADQLSVPVFVVNRFTGSLMVEVTFESCSSSGDNNEIIGKHNQYSETIPDNNGENNIEKKKCGQKSFANIGLNLKRNRSGAQVLGWSRFCTVRHTWLFSDRTVDLLKKFSEKFPSVWEKVLKSSDSCKRNNSCIKLNSKEVDEIMEFIANSECRNAPVLPQKGIYLDKEWLQKLKSLYLKDMDKTVCEPVDHQIWNKKPPVNCSPTTLFVSVNSDTRIYPSSYNLSPFDRCYYSSNCSSVFSSFTLLDKVVYIGIGQNIPLGLHGIVIGVPSGSQKSEQLVEVMFCRTFTDAIDIRGSGPFCALVHPSMLLRLPEKSDDKHQSTSQPKLTRPVSKPVQASWVTKGPPRNYRPWPTNNKFDQNTSHKKKIDDSNHSNISKANPVHSWNSSKLKTKQKQLPQQQLQQQNIKPAKKPYSTEKDPINKATQERDRRPPYVNTYSTLPTVQNKFPNHSRSISELHTGLDDNNDNVSVSNSSHDAEHNSHFWTMPSPPDVPLPPSYWSNISKPTNDLKLNKTKDDKEKNPQNKKEKSTGWSNLKSHSGNSVERNQRNSMTRCDNRSRLNHNNDVCQKAPNPVMLNQIPMPVFERQNFNRPPNMGQCPPLNQMQPQLQSAYQPLPFLQFQRVIPPTVYPINMTTPYLYDRRMSDSSYISYSPMPMYPPNFVNRAPIPQFQLMSNPNAQVFNSTMNYENTNRLNNPPMLSYGERNRLDSYRPPVKQDLPSNRSTTPHHNANQSRRFIPPQVSRTRRP
uniref:5'-3' exoribonuclease, putative n=1 Tax=Schistosoma mansoni TaxID=6183 RepID=A0A5K4EPZ7_SCHMA